MTDPTVEAVARAICSADCEGPCDCPIWEDNIAQAEAAIAAHLKVLEEQGLKIIDPRPRNMGVGPPVIETAQQEVQPYEMWALAQAELLDAVEMQGTEDEMRVWLKERFALAAKHGFEVKFEAPGSETSQ